MALTTTFIGDNGGAFWGDGTATSVADVPIGTPSASRIVVAFIATTNSTLTIGGVEATPDPLEGGLWMAVVPEGETATFESESGLAVIAVWAVTGDASATWTEDIFSPGGNETIVAVAPGGAVFAAIQNQAFQGAVSFIPGTFDPSPAVSNDQTNSSIFAYGHADFAGNDLGGVDVNYTGTGGATPVLAQAGGLSPAGPTGAAAIAFSAFIFLGGKTGTAAATDNKKASSTAGSVSLQGALGVAKGGVSARPQACHVSLIGAQGSVPVDLRARAQAGSSNIIGKRPTANVDNRAIAQPGVIAAAGLHGVATIGVRASAQAGTSAIVGARANAVVDNRAFAQPGAAAISGQQGVTVVDNRAISRSGSATVSGSMPHVAADGKATARAGHTSLAGSLGVAVLDMRATARSGASSLRGSEPFVLRRDNKSAFARAARIRTPGSAGAAKATANVWAFPASGRSRITGGGPLVRTTNFVFARVTAYGHVVVSGSTPKIVIHELTPVGRTVLVPEEERSSQVYTDERTGSVLAEVRKADVGFELRGAGVLAEDRIVTFPADIRSTELTEDVTSVGNRE